MENIKEQIDEFLKRFQGRNIKDYHDVYNSLIAYDRDVNKLARSCKLYDNLTLEQEDNYMYKKWDLKPCTSIFSENMDDYYKGNRHLLSFKDAFDYDKLSIHGKEESCLFKTLIKLLKENKRVMDSILIGKQLCNKKIN